MPYIAQDRRPEYDEHIDALYEKLDGNDIVTSPGDVNYVISRLLWRILCRGHRGRRYVVLNAIQGILVCVALELYRRLGAEMEDDAAKKNGDILI